MARSHTGNIRYYHIIATHQEQYDDARSHDERSIIAAAIVLSIKESGGRFLKLDGTNNSWLVVDDDTARVKVTNSFRTRRRRLAGYATEYSVCNDVEARAKRKQSSCS